MAYIVSKPFLYGGVAYAHGASWEPTGHRNDNAIIKSRMVVDPALDPALRRQDARKALLAVQQPARERGRRVPREGA